MIKNINVQFVEKLRLFIKMAIDGVNNKQMKTQQSNEDFGAFADNGLFL